MEENSNNDYSHSSTATMEQGSDYNNLIEERKRQQSREKYWRHKYEEISTELEELEGYRLCVEWTSAAFRQKTKLLSDGEKVLFEVLLKEVMFGDGEVEDGYRRVLTSDIYYKCGSKARTGTIIERILNMGLFEQARKEHLEGELWLHVPENIKELLRDIPSEFARNWHASRWCPSCNKNIVPRIINRTHQVLECPDCKTKVGEEYHEVTYEYGEEKSREVLSSEEFHRREGHMDK